METKPCVLGANSRRIIALTTSKLNDKRCVLGIVEMGSHSRKLKERKNGKHGSTSRLFE